MSFHITRIYVPECHGLCLKIWVPCSQSGGFDGFRYIRSLGSRMSRSMSQVSLEYLALLGFQVLLYEGGFIRSIRIRKFRFQNCHVLCLEVRPGFITSRGEV